MKDFMTVHKIYCIKEIINNVRSSFLCECFSTWNNVIQLSIAAKFHNCIEILFITKISVIFDDVWMI